VRQERRRITGTGVIKNKIDQGQYDVFLSHNSKDKPAVEEIAIALRSLGIRPWLDKWDLIPGARLTDVLERAISSIPCGVLFFGPADIGKWHAREIDAYLHAWIDHSGRLVPVILPGVGITPDLPIFLRQSVWVDLRDGYENGSDGFYRLVCGIVNRAPGSASRIRLSARDVHKWQQG
jgi:hypothetical protein